MGNVYVWNYIWFLRRHVVTFQLLNTQKFPSEGEFAFMYFLEFLNANKEYFKVPEIRGWNLFLILRE